MAEKQSKADLKDDSCFKSGLPRILTNKGSNSPVHTCYPFNNNQIFQFITGTSYQLTAYRQTDREVYTDVDLYIKIKSQ